jgi:hypothetical protein
MSGAARCDRPTEAALQVIPPAIGTLIGHLTGRVIWDSPTFSCCKRSQPAIHSAPDVSDYAFDLLLGLGFEDVATRGRLRDGIHAGLRPTQGPVAVGGPLTRMVGLPPDGARPRRLQEHGRLTVQRSKAVVKTS